MTFASKVSVLKDDYNIFIKNCQGKIPQDFKIFIELIRRKNRKLITPIPSYSTHGQNPWIAKLFNWKNII